MTKKAVKNLYAETVTAKPLNFDFSKGYTETWDIAVNLTEAEQENEEYAPMMNYIYPLPRVEDFERDMGNMFGDDWPTKIKKALVTTTLVKLLDSDGYTDAYYLALTGGGMDLSWEICETYINLGYLPPLHFCDLPNMGGIKYNTAKIRRIIQACKRSCDISIRWAKQTKHSLKQLHNYSTNKQDVKA